MTHTSWLEKVRLKLLNLNAAAIKEKESLLEAKNKEKFAKKCQNYTYHKKKLTDYTTKSNIR